MTRVSGTLRQDGRQALALSPPFAPTSSLTNVSLLTSLEAAKRLDTFQPMLELAKPFAAKGATFERSILKLTRRCGNGKALGRAKQGRGGRSPAATRARGDPTAV